MITYYIMAVILGWLAGMLVNYLADVLPLRRKFTQPFCIHCDTPQAWGHYLFWPRRCPVCNQPRSIRVWLVELFYIAASVFIIISPPARLEYALGLIILVYFGVVVLIDLEYRIIMHPVSIVGTVLGVIVGVVRVGWLKTLVGGVTGFAIMWLLYMLGILIIKVADRMRNRPVNDVALGFGDVNLSGVLGLMLGWPLNLVGLVLAILCGGLVSLVYLIVKLSTRSYQAFMALPYGPFLVLGAVALIYFGQQISAWIGK